MILKLSTLGLAALTIAAFAQNDTSGQSANQNGTRTTAGEGRTSGPKEEGVFSRKWRGTLVDSGCASEKVAGGRPEKADERQARISPFSNQAFAGHPVEIIHRPLAEWESCTARADTSHFGLVLPDGRFVWLDDPGNGKAAARLTTGKPANVKIRGTLVGDTLEVESLQ